MDWKKIILKVASFVAGAVDKVKLLISMTNLMRPLHTVKIRDPGKRPQEKFQRRTFLEEGPD